MFIVRVSTSSLQKQIEQKAYAFGTSPAVASLLGEYVVELLQKEVKKQFYTEHPAVVHS